jgi:hypothetical protein
MAFGGADNLGRVLLFVLVPDSVYVDQPQNCLGTVPTRGSFINRSITRIGKPFEPCHGRLAYHHHIARFHPVIPA